MLQQFLDEIDILRMVEFSRMRIAYREQQLKYNVRPNYSRRFGGGRVLLCLLKKRSSSPGSVTIIPRRISLACNENSA